MIYAISGQTHPFYISGQFINFFIKHNVSSVLVIGEHHTKGGLYAMDKIEHTAKGLHDNDIHFVHGNYRLFDKIGNDLSQFDGLYITGGLTDHLQIYLSSYSLYPAIIEFIRDKRKVFVGASAGTTMLGQKLFTESENDAIHISRFSHEGFDIFPSTLFEVHYDEGGNKTFLDQRIKNCLAENPDVKQAILMNSHCCIALDPENRDNPTLELLEGNYFLVKSHR